MAEDISTLILQVKSDGIKEGTDQLTALTDAAAKAEGATKKLGTEVAQTEAASRKASGSAKAMADAEDTVTKAVGAVTTAYQKKAVEQRREVELYNQSNRAYAQVQAEAIRMNAAIDKSAAAMERAHAQALLLNAAYDKRTSAKQNADIEKAWAEALAQKAAMQKQDIALYNEQARAYAAAHTEALKMNKAMDDGGESAHGNAAAVREVMVLMHELSQGSYKRLGGSVMVLTNQMDVIPKTMALMREGSWGTIASFAAMGLGIGALVAGVGALVFGMMQGVAQQKAFNDSLLETGNYAGTTVDGMRSIASAAAGTHMSVGTAKDAVLQLAQSGRFTASQMTLLASSATAVEEAFGVSVEDTVKQFETLSTLAITNTSRSTNVIAQHTLKMNEHYHFLTTAQFEHIVMLEKEGKAIEAAQFATETFATVQKQRAQESLDNLGYVATAWHGIKNAISGAMDAIGKVGAKKTLGEELAALKAQRQTTSRSFATDEAANNSPELKSIDAAIVAKEKEIQSATLKAQKEGQDQQRHEREMNAENRLNGLIAQNDKEFKKRQELNDLQDRWDQASKEYRLTHEKEYQAARAKIEADGKDKAPKGNDTRTVDRDTAVDDLKASNRAQLEELDGFITLSKERAKKEGANRWAELAERKDYYAQEHTDLAEALKKELAIYDAYAANGKHTPRELAQNKRKRDATVKSYDIKDKGVTRDENKDKEDVYAAEEQEMDKLEKKSDQTYKAESKRITDLVEAEKIRLKGIEDLKSAKIAAQAVKEDTEADTLQHEYEVREGMITLMQETGLWSARRVEIEEGGLSALKTEIAGRRELAALHRQESTAQKGKEDFARTTKDLDTAIAAGKRFEKALTAAFGNVGKAIGGVSNAFLQMAKDKNDAQAHYNSLSEDEQKTEKAKGDLAAANTDASITGYANMADAAKGFFDEKSKGFQIAEGISKAFHIAELARNGIQMVSNLATGASKMFAQSGWGGFAGIAAMAATMAAFGIAVAGSSNSGGKSAEEVQKTQGTGTVFGDIGTTNSDGTVTYKTKSDSISKSLEILKDNSNVMLPVNQAMLASLQGIQASMSGLTNLVVRTTGVTDGTNMGIQTGTLGHTIGSGATAVGALAGGASAGAYMGSMVGSFLGPLGAVAGGILGAIGGAIIGKVASLWGKTTQEIKDAGLQLSGKVSDLESGSGFSQYASVDTTKSSWFGMSKSTSNKVVTQGLDSELSQQFGLVFSNLESTLKLAAGDLGKTSDQVGKAIENMVIDTTQVSLKGLTGQDLTDAINGVISKTMDNIAQAAFPAMDDFRQVGEGYAQTVIRVASGIEVADAAMKKFGITAVSYTDIINKQGDVSVEIAKQSIAAYEGLNGVNDIIQSMSGSISDLTDMYGSLVAIRKQMNGVGLNGKGLGVDVITGAGGVSQLGSALSDYQDKFFTDQEKAGIMLKSVTEDFNKLGVALPNSKKALRDLITATGTSTPEAAEKTGQLLALSSAYSDLIDAANTAGSTVTDALSTTIDGLKTFSDSLHDLKNSLLLGDLSTLTPTEKYVEAKKEYEDTVAKAMSGDATAQGNVSAMSQSFLEAARTVFASSPEYSAAFNEVQSNLDNMSALTDAKLSDAQQQLTVLQAQADSLDTLNATASGIQDSINNLALVATPQTVTVDMTAVKDQLAALGTQLEDTKTVNAQQIMNLIAAVYDSNSQNAATISQAVSSTATTQAWAAQTATTLTTER